MKDTGNLKLLTDSNSIITRSCPRLMLSSLFALNVMSETDVCYSFWITVVLMSNIGKSLAASILTSIWEKMMTTISWLNGSWDNIFGTTLFFEAQPWRFSHAWPWFRFCHQSPYQEKTHDTRVCKIYFIFCSVAINRSHLMAVNTQNDWNW